MKGWRSSAVIAALAAFAAACGSDSSTAPKTDQPLDVAAVLAQMSMGDATQMSGAQASLGLPTTIGTPHTIASSCAYSVATQGFECAPVNHSGLTYTLSYWLYDASGHALSTPDAAKTASMRTVTDVTGTMALPTLSGVTSETIGITSHSDMTLSGLQSASRTLNGMSAAHYDVQFSSSTPVRSVMDDTSHTTNVVLPAQPTNGQYWPASGTIASDSHFITSSGSLPTISITSHLLITFNGTSKVTITMTSGGTTSTCTIDLSGQSPASCS